MATCTLTGSWVAPDLTPRTGKVIATLDDATRVPSVAGSAAAGLVAGALPTSGAGALKIATPVSGTATYIVRERLDDVTEATYRITVLPGDTVIDLTTRP